MIILSTKANADVDRLYNFLAPKNLDAAIRAMEAIWKKLELVERRPAIGRPTKSPFVRQVKVDFGKRGYVVRYTIRESDGALIVLRIWHGRENRP